MILLRLGHRTAPKTSFKASRFQGFQDLSPIACKHGNSQHVCQAEARAMFQGLKVPRFQSFKVSIERGCDPNRDESLKLCNFETLKPAPSCLSQLQ
jgi:hypothetical protein